MYELRILSGLHRGATLPLDERPHIIGASEDADVVIVDPEIEPQHASLELAGDTWVLAGLEGSVRDAHTNQPQTSLRLAPGDFARVGSVWVTVVEQNAGWENPPREPDEDLFDAVAEAASAETEQHSEEETETSPRAENETASAQGNDAPAKKRRTGLIFASAGAAILACAAGAWALSSGGSPLRMQAKSGEAAAPASAASAASARDSASGAKPADPTVAKAFDTLNPDGTAKRKLTTSELRKAFRKRLADADLLRKFDLTLQDEQWSMQASLDDEEAARFERILVTFFKTYDIAIPVHAVIGNGEAMLPFKILQVVSGRDASVVTKDGERLYVGDELRGVRLLAIRGSHLTFAGKRRIEVTW